MNGVNLEAQFGIHIDNSRSPGKKNIAKWQSLNSLVQILSAIFMADAREILSNREFVRRMTSFNLVSQLLSRVNIGSSFIKIIEWCHISKSGCYSWQSPLETKVAMLSKGIREQLWVRVSPSFIVQTQPFDPVCRAQIIELPCLSYATLNCITRGKRGESPWVPTSPYPVRNIIFIQPRTVYKTIWVYLILYIGL